MRASSGTTWWSGPSERGLWGIENLSLIPGKAGRGAGAEHRSLRLRGEGRRSRRVEMFCIETGAMLTLDAAHCGFGYRESVFKHDAAGAGGHHGRRDCALTRTPRPRLGYGDVAREVEARGEACRCATSARRSAAIRRAKLPDPAVAGQRGQLLQEPGGRGGRGGAAAGGVARHAALPRSRTAGVKLAAGWLIDRAGVERPPRRGPWGCTSGRRWCW